MPSLEGLKIDAILHVDANSGAALDLEHLGFPAAQDAVDSQSGAKHTLYKG